jgi:hypothetical protein
LTDGYGALEALYRLEVHQQTDGYFERLSPGRSIRRRSFFETRTEPPSYRILYPPVTTGQLERAEELLQCRLPPLLRAIYREVGNGGYALRLMGIEGGRQGVFIFPGSDIVAAYRQVIDYQQTERGECWPKGLVPIWDEWRCGWVDLLDCGNEEGPVRQWDDGRLLLIDHSLAEYVIRGARRPDEWVDPRRGDIVAIS